MKSTIWKCSRAFHSTDTLVKSRMVKFYGYGVGIYWPIYDYLKTDLKYFIQSRPIVALGASRIRRFI